MSSSDLHYDHAMFRNANKLRQEGALLVEASENANVSGGRVVFSLQEIPLRRRFQTSNGNYLRRERNDLVVLWAPDQSVSVKIPVSNFVNTGNKDVFFWAQVQNDLLLFDDAKYLAASGAIVTEQVSGRQIEIRALTDLPIGTKYFTEHGNVIQRESANEISLGDKVLYVTPPPPSTPSVNDDSTYSCSGSGDTSDSLPSSDDEGGRTPTEMILVASGKLLAAVVAADEQQELSEAEYTIRKKRAIIEEEIGQSQKTKGAVAAAVAAATAASGNQSFPRITRCSIDGSGFHMDELRFQYSYTGGTEGKSLLRWERSELGQAFHPIPNARSLLYRPSLEDLGTEIRVAYTPVRADGVTGAIVYSPIVRIKLDPEVAAEVESNLALSTLQFKVLMCNGSEFQKRSVLLSKRKIKIRKRRTTMAKTVFGRSVSVAASLDNDCHFVVGLNTDEFYSFIAPSCYQRDIIVLTIQMFNEKERA